MGIIHQQGTKNIGAPWIQTSGKRRFGGVSWWLAGGVDPANCVAAYQPKGAASLAASYINLANPGTYNATPGVAPTWDATNGWKGNGIDQYLDTGVILSNRIVGSLIVRYTNLILNVEALLGSIQIRISKYGDAMSATHTNSLTTAPGLAAGVYALSGNKAYRNGVVETGTITLVPGSDTTNIYILAVNNSPAPVFFSGAYIQAVAIYDIDVTAPQIVSLTTAMAAL